MHQPRANRLSRVSRWAGVGLISLALVACAGDSDPDDTDSTPTATPEVSASASAEPTTDPASTDAITGTADDLPYAAIDIATLEGVSEQSESEDGPTLSHSFTWFDLEDAPYVAEVVYEEMETIRAEFAAQVGTPAADSPIIQEVTVTAHLVALSDEVVGVWLEIYRFYGANGGEESRTLWFDRASESRMGAVDLLAGQAALDDLAATAREALERDREDLATAGFVADGTAPTAALFDAIAFTPAGDLLVEFDEGQVGPTASGTPRVAIPADAATVLLSDLGLRARDAVLAAQ
jgi:hypothetical protein